MSRNRNRIYSAARRRDAIRGYCFIFPFIIGFFFLFLIPLMQSVVFSFSHLLTSPTGYELSTVGWSNYHKLLFVDVGFRQELLSSFSSMATQVPVIVIFSFFAATLISREFKGRAFVRSVFFIPVILTSGVIVQLEASDILVNGLSGIGDSSSVVLQGASDYLSLESMLLSLGVGQQIVNFITVTVDGIYNITISSGVQIIIFLSGLQSIPKSIYEAADVEGATGWEAFWKITFPMVGSLILVNTIYSIVDFFVKSTNVVMKSIQETSIKLVDYGLAAAMSWLYFIPIFIFLLVVGLIISRRVFYYD